MSIDSAHALRIEVARLTKERDELKLQVESKHNALIALREQCDEAREACAAEKARADAAEAINRRMAGDFRDESERRDAAEEALATARRETKLLREALERIRAYYSVGTVAHSNASAALAGPAAAPGKEG